jgi:multiple antibiotic resistance protein
MLGRFVHDSAVLFATIDPIGSVLVFVAVTKECTGEEKRRIALKAVLLSGAILVAFMVLGEVVLASMHVGLRSFQIAGALFLFFFGAQLTFGQGGHAAGAPEPGHDLAVFPLAVPAIASPGAITAVVVLTNNDISSIGMQLLTAVALLLVLACTWAMLLGASFVHRILGNSGASVLIRILGLLLASLAVQMLVEALQGSGLPRSIPT